MKKINWKILNAAFWTEILLSYFLPFQTTDNSLYQVGFPEPFLSVYATNFGVSPFTSMHLNPLALLFDIIIIHLVISVCINIYHKFFHTPK